MAENKDFATLITECMEAKEELKRAKDKEAKLCKEVKQQMTAQGLTMIKENGIKVNYHDVKKSSLNEDKLLQVMTNILNTTENIEDKYKIAKAFEQKTVINEDVVQDLIYEGLINVEDLELAYEEKTIKTLRVTRLNK